MTWRDWWRNAKTRRRAFACLLSGIDEDGVPLGWMRRDASGAVLVAVARKREPVSTRATGAGNIDKTTALGGPFVLRGVTLHFAASWDEDVTVTKKSGAGALYDTVLKVLDAGSGCTDLFWPADADSPFVAGDQVQVTATNPGTTVYGLEIVTEGA